MWHSLQALFGRDPKPAHDGAQGGPKPERDGPQVGPKPDQDGTKGGPSSGFTSVLSRAALHLPQEGLEQAHLFLQLACSGLKNDRLDEAGSLGPWSVRETLAVLWAWLEVYASLLRGVGLKMPGHPAPLTNVEPWLRPGTLHTVEAHEAFAAEVRAATAQVGAGEIFLALERQHLLLLGGVSTRGWRRLQGRSIAPGITGSVEGLDACTAGDLLQRFVDHKVETAHCVRAWRLAGGLEFDSACSRH